MALAYDLIPAGTRVTANGESAVADVRESSTRTFVCALEITDQIEQESVDISVYGSADGSEWDKMPLLKMQQEFYRGLTRQVLDLTFRPEVKFLRAKWELVRWGRVAPTPMFVLGFRLEEVPVFTRASAR
jgi:hypothetical protein